MSDTPTRVWEPPKMIKGYQVPEYVRANWKQPDQVRHCFIDNVSTWFINDVRQYPPPA